LVRYDSDGSECPFAARDGVCVLGGTDVALGDESGDEVGGDDTALGMGCEEDEVGAAEVVNPCGVGEVGFV
jgi:hypothetical protein